jgi:outer membrane protein OmpA-like peptidoglycan-associated protein
MRTVRCIMALCVAALLATGVARSEPRGKHFDLTPFGGYTIFDPDLNYPGTHPLKDNLYAGGRLGYQFLPLLALEIAGGFTPTSEDVADGKDVDYMHVSGNLLLTPWNRGPGGVFLFAGGGAARLKPSGGGDALDQGTLELGGGVRYWFNDRVGVRLEARNISWVNKEFKDLETNHVVLGAGITLALGGTPRDIDGDGVPDRKDKCPDTPQGARVDESGCPIDSDGDGIFDGLDQCPSTPRGCKVDAKGCPTDSDGDGVCDGLDQCPDTPKGCKADARGCTLDADGDGVCDGLDQCANTPKGCKVDAKGCTLDADGDGICDGLDKCPDTAAGLKVDSDGCPIEVTERETELLDTGMIRLQDINFETGKADILAESHSTLDVVGQVLNKWPELKIEIGGHTDSRGSDAYNQKLSEARAKAVLDYLLQKFPGLKPEQFSARGYGESQPVAPNTTPLNMAKNRRVEFKVLNKEVLKREVERRRMLPK